MTLDRSPTISGMKSLFVISLPRSLSTHTYDVEDVQALPRALQRLYPKMSLPPFDGFPPGFVRDRDAVLARRKTPEYRWVESIVRRPVRPSLSA
jgi:hypothetical protein